MTQHFKKTLLASALTMTALSAFAQEAPVTVYGVIDTGVRVATHQPGANATAANPDSGTTTSVFSGGLLTSRIGFKGTEDLGNGYKALFQLESGLQINNGSLDNPGVLFNRISHVGITNGKESVFVGREYNENYFSLFEVDPLNFRIPGLNPNVMVGTLNDTTSFGSELPGQVTNRLNNAVRYEGNYGDFRAGAQLSSGGAADSSANNSYGARLSYKYRNTLVVSGSMERYKDASKNYLDAYTLGAKYFYTPELSFAATFADQTVHGGPADQYERRVTSVGAYYAPTSLARRFTYGLAYYLTEGKNFAGVIGKDGSQHRLIGLTAYNFSERTSVYGEFDYTKNKDAFVSPLTTQPTVTAVSFGIQHKF